MKWPTAIVFKRFGVISWLLAAAVILWIRSYWATDVFVVRRTADTFTSFTCDHGHLLFDHCHFPLPRGRLDTVYEVEGSPTSGRAIVPDHSAGIGGLGFTLNVAAVDNTTDYAQSLGTLDELAIPIWPLILCLAVPSIRRTYRRWRVFQRHRSGLCKACGYDLRGSLTRCPECGLAMSAKTAS